MSWLAKVSYSLKALFTRKRRDQELSEEIRIHLDFATETNVAKGMSADEARYAALRELGNIAGIQEASREVRGWSWLEHCVRDLRYAVRYLRKTPRFCVVAIVSIGLGIGVMTSLFSILNARLFQTVAATDPQSLLIFHWSLASGAPRYYDANGGMDGDAISGQTRLHFPREVFERFSAESRVLSDVCATAHMFANAVVVDQVPQFVPVGLLVSGNYYPMLGVQAFRGRTIMPEDDRTTAAPVCMVSYHFWKGALGGAESAIGKVILVNRLPVTIVGVTPEGFSGLFPIGNGPEITLPLSTAMAVRHDPELISKPSACWLRIIARRRPEISLTQVQLALQNTFRSIAAELQPDDQPKGAPRLFAIAAGHTHSPSQMRQDWAIFLPIAGMATLVLLAGCANFAMLLLARGAGRRREIATRLALGASRSRVVQQLLLETGFLALGGGALGVAISRLNLALLIQMFPNPSSGYSAWIDPDSLVLSPAPFLFAFALSGITGIIFGLAPALRVTRLNLTDEFQGGAHTYGAPTLSRTGQFLVLVQIAVACVLLIGASLFGRTVRNLEAIDLGINRQNILMFAIDARSAGIAEKQYGAFPERIAEKLRGVPGVRRVAYSGWPVLTGEGGPFSAKISFPGTDTIGVSLWNQVNPTFFETYGAPVVAGRALEENDVESKRKVVVINESFARQFFPTENALGHSVHFQKQNWEIVGLVRDARLTRASLRGTVDPVMFLPFSQNPQSVARFAVNTASDPEVVLKQIRRAIAEVAPDAIPIGVTTQEEQISWRFFMERLFGRIAAYVGALALTLAAIGLGGLMAHSTAQRTGEIGIRMALGAQPKAILAMVLRQTLFIVGAGLLCGLASAAAVTRLISNRLYGLSALDPVTYAAVALVLLIVAVLATWQPARRASLINPIDALRNE